MIQFVFLLIFTLVEANKIYYVKGLVALKRADKMYRAKKDIPLKNEDIIQTGKDGLAIIEYGNKSKIKLDPRSELKFEDYFEGGKKKRKRSVIGLLRGNMLMHFKKDRENKDVQVKVKQVSVGVRGTRFLVSSSSKEDSNAYVAVKEGLVDVYNFEENDFESIRGGNALVVEEGGRLTKPHPFEWVDKLNWDVTSSAPPSLFNTPDLKNFRLKEVDGLLDKLRIREPKNISKGIMRRWEKMKTDSLKFKSPVEKVRDRSRKEQKKIRNKVNKKVDEKIDRKINDRIPKKEDVVKDVFKGLL